MSSEYESLIDAKKKWLDKIEMYRDFLQGEAKTFEGKFGAEEYISMAENRLNDINQKLMAIEKDNSNKRN